MTNAHFIPFRKSDIIAMCLQDSDFDPGHKEAFSDCCTLLQSTLHVEFHRRLERLKTDTRRLTRGRVPFPGTAGTRSSAMAAVLPEAAPATDHYFSTTWETAHARQKKSSKASSVADPRRAPGAPGRARQFL
jgi:hypothetical protein